MFDENDLAFFDKYQIVVAPALPIQALNDLKELANNPFLYLEQNERFLKNEFIKFPDEQRQLTYQDKHYLCFGKNAYEGIYFVIGQDDKIVYELCVNEDGVLIICPTNNHIANFTASHHYFLMAIHQLIAKTRQSKIENYDDEMAIYEQIANEFRANIEQFDDYAFADNQKSYWGMVYEMLAEADLAFYLPSVSLMEYMQTKRFRVSNG